MQESTQNIKAIRLPAAAIGLLAGFSAAYLACFFADFTYIYDGLIFIFLPFIVLGIIVFLLWIRKPLSASDAWRFVVFFWIPFVSLFVVTSILYWGSRA